MYSASLAQQRKANDDEHACVQVNTAAVSTVDYIAMVCLMSDMRIKLLEDAAEQQQVSSMLKSCTGL